MRVAKFGLVVLFAASGCGPTEQQVIDSTILLTVENRTGGQLWHFQYSDCGADDWTEVIGDTEYVADGDDVSSIDLAPGCFDLYVEDEFGCSAENSTDGNVAAGQQFTWTLTESDMSLICL